MLLNFSENLSPNKVICQEIFSKVKTHEKRLEINPNLFVVFTIYLQLMR